MVFNIPVKSIWNRLKEQFQLFSFHEYLDLWHHWQTPTAHSSRLYYFVEYSAQDCLQHTSWELTNVFFKSFWFVLYFSNCNTKGEVKMQNFIIPIIYEKMWPYQLLLPPSMIYVGNLCSLNIRLDHIVYTASPHSFYQNT